MKRKTTEEFIAEAMMVHGDKYDYSKVDYVNRQTKVCIICPEHGEFWQTPGNHLSGYGCLKCGIEQQTLLRSLTTNDFIEKAKNVHGDKYDYSKVEYVNSHTKVCIICLEHGEFWQTPGDHLSGCGCPKCNTSLLEKSIMKFLDNHNIRYETQKRFRWLKNKKPLPLDFFLTDCNVAIECQGIQHFQECAHFDADTLEERKKKDEIKRVLCERHSIPVFYFSNLGIEYPYKVYEDIEELFKEINNVLQRGKYKV